MSLQQRHSDTVSRHLIGIDGQGNVTATPCQLYTTRVHASQGRKISVKPLLAVSFLNKYQ